MQKKQYLKVHKNCKNKVQFLSPLIPILCFLFSLSGCSNRVDRAKIEGLFSGNPKSWVYISKLEGDSLRVVDSLKTSSKGRFNINFECISPYILTVGLDRVKNPIVLVVEPGNEIKIEASGKDLTDYRVIGSEGSALVRNLYTRLNKVRFQIDSVGKFYDLNFGNPKIDSIQHLLDSTFNGILAKHQKFTYSFIKDNPYSLASILALYQAYDPLHPVLDYSKDKDLFKMVDASLMSVYSSNSIVKTLHARIATLDTLYEQRHQRDQMYREGWVLPDAAFSLISGEYFFASTVWYKYILIDFWANWCDECKRNTTDLRQIYKEFGPKGLAILQVSLDHNIDSLKAIVARDSLTWYHAYVQDIYKSRLLDTLKISSIPASYITDRWGNIKGVNLKGDKLKSKLKELFP